MRRQATLLAAATVLSACGLSVVGAEDADTDGSPPGADASSGQVPRDATTGDAADAAATDAGSCQLVFADDFSAGLAKWTTYGGVESVEYDGNRVAEIVSGYYGAHRGAAAGMFFFPSVLRTGFIAEFRYHVRSTHNTGDGLTFTWLTSVDKDWLGIYAVPGRGLGLTPGVTGYSFAFDAVKNADPRDITAPSYGLLQLEADEEDEPGDYDWHVAQTSATPFGPLYDTLRKVRVVVGEGKVSAFVVNDANAIPVFSDVPIDTYDPIAAIGFTASTGAARATFSVDDVKVWLPTCPPATFAPF
ncbi:MAG TPA: hypothetical protein VM580_07710 [Labilithrix sp.]|nr:hypothetical protein [Labilithrix sp.]